MGWSPHVVCDRDTAGAECGSGGFGGYRFDAGGTGGTVILPNGGPGGGTNGNTGANGSAGTAGNHG
ncbi:hypothetical protein [Mycobacterium sp.]|uniref:hypothetical protein n=1 Tax=Mycobacterium sp. TaxID=1785 RepID=UPI003F9B92FF